MNNGEILKPDEALAKELAVFIARDEQKRERRNNYARQWRKTHPEKIKQYQQHNKKWRQEHKALLDYRRRLKGSQRNKYEKEYRRKHPEKCREYRRKYLLNHPEQVEKRKKQIPFYLLRRFRCIDCNCWFYADHGEYIDRWHIICRDCLEERKMHDEAPYAPREIIALAQEERWVTAALTFVTEYRRNPWYYYCPGE